MPISPLKMKDSNNLHHLVNTNASVRSDGKTPLHEALLRGQTEIARLCISHGAEVRAKTKLGFTPLHAASQEGWLEIVRMLVAAGASYGDRNIYGHAPIHLAAQNNHTAVVRFLVREAGCPVELVSGSL